MADEKQVASGSYIITFLNDIEQLLDYASAYLNILINLNAKYGNSEEVELTPTENENLQQITNILRSLVFKTHTRLNSVLSATDLKEEEKNKINKKLKEIESCYEEVKGNNLFEFDIIEKYTKALNDVFINVIALNEIIKSSRKIVEGLSK